MDIAESGLHELGLGIDRNCAVEHEEIVGDVCDAMLLKGCFSALSSAYCFACCGLQACPADGEESVCRCKDQRTGHAAGCICCSCIQGRMMWFWFLRIRLSTPPVSWALRSESRNSSFAANRSAVRMKAVRLGNVWGSTGSIVPLLQRQIAQGGPITITDAACTRHFLSIAKRYSVCSSRFSPGNLQQSSSRRRVPLTASSTLPGSCWIVQEWISAKLNGDISACGREKSSSSR